MAKRIVLISCASKKCAQRTKAKDLYISTLFRFNLKYAYSLKPDAVFILSAKYGLLDLDAEIEPYNVTLNKMTSQENRRWATLVIDALGERFDLKKDHFVFLAGNQYRKNLISAISSYEVPLNGLSIGRQLQFLRKAI